MTVPLMTHCCVGDPAGNGKRPQPGVHWSDTGEFSSLLRKYYRNRTVRDRLCEFLGGSNPKNATAAYIVGTDGWSDYSEPSFPSLLPEYLETGMEVDRSFWDRDSLIVDADLEYDNFDNPAAAWLDPERAFGLQSPVLDATLRILSQAGLDPLILVSGRGFHLVWAIARSSTAFRRLARLGRVPPTLEARYAQLCAPAGIKVDPELGRAYAGLGMVIEFAGHQVVASSAGTCSVPVQLTAIEVGSGPDGREIVSFDISEYGDPLHTRHIRLPFSAYLKPRRFEWALGEAGVRQLLPIFEIPLSGMLPRDAINVARDPDKTLDLSRHIRVTIPDQSAQMERLLDDYQASELAGFHDQFYSEPWERDGFGSIQVPDVPPCVDWLLDHPNDWLLKPAALQHVARVLTALDWRPRDIAQVIYECYRKDGCWSDADWVRLDPLNRAIFYTRLFTGMIATGTDKLIDLNCVSHREKGYCMVPECFSNLVPYRNKLLERRLH
jgi:hypothetical protein